MKLIKGLLKYILFLATLVYFSNANANSTPNFVLSSPQNLSVCKNSINNGLGTFLRVSDLDTNQLEIWSINSAPSHGTLIGFDDTMRSTGGIITPGSLFYTPSSGYTGTDSFRIQISDSIATSILTIIVTVHALPAIVISPANPTICLGNNATLTASGASTYSWSPSVTLSASTGNTVVASPTDTTIYTVAGIDAFGCTNIQRDTVIVNPIPSAPTVVSPLSYCQNSPDTALTATGTGLLWYAARTGGTGSVTAPMRGTATTGARSFYVAQTADGCESARDSIIITINPLPTITISPATAVICNGLDTTLTATGGISYAWFPTTGLNDSTGSVVSAGPTTTRSYTVTGINTFGCTNTASRLVSVNPTPPSINVTGGRGITCLGHSISLTNGSSGGTWSISDTAIAVIAPSGTHCVLTGVDTGVVILKYAFSTGCNATKIISVHEYNLHLGDFHTCAGNRRIVEDISTHEIWGDYYGSAVAYPSVISVSNTYAGGCLLDYMVIIDTMPNPIDGSPSLCVGTTDTLSNGVTGGTWSSSNSGVATVNATTGVVFGVSAGSAYITYTLPSNCDTMMLVTVHALPTLGRLSVPLCRGFSTTLTSSGAVSYSWSPAGTLSSTVGSSVTASPTITTTYTVTGTDVYGCINSTTDTVHVNAIPSPPVPVTPVQFCQNTTATPLSATGASLLWYTVPSGGTGSATAPTPPTSAAGTIKRYVSQTVLGCQSPRDSISVIILPQPSIAISPSIANVCIGNNLALTASGSSGGYTWSPSTNLSATTGTTVTASPTITTTYAVTGIGTNSCSATSTRIVKVNSLPTITITPANPTICLGTSTTLTGNGGNTYSWLPLATLSSGTGTNVVATPTVSTVYTVTGTDTNGCINTANDLVTINSVATRPTVTSPVSYCRNASASGLVATGTSLLWYTTRTGGVGSATTPVPSTSTVGTTIYYVSQTLSGCESPRDSIFVTILPLPVIAISPATATICLGSDTTLIASGGVTYNWVPATGLSTTTGSTTHAQPTALTTYTVTVTDVNGCKDTASRRVVVNALPTISATPSRSTICNHTNSSITANGGISYIWANAATLSSSTGVTVTATPTVSTIYTVTGTGSNGCINRFMDTVNVNAVPSAPAVVSPVRYCQNSTDTPLNATGIALLWYTTSTGGTGSSVTPVPSTSTVDTTTWYVTQTVGGCESPRDSVSVTILPLPIITVSPAAAVICAGFDTTLIASGGISYSWSPTAGLSVSTGSITRAQPGVTTIYTVTGFDLNGCNSTASRTVTVNALPPVSVTPSNSTICNHTNSSLTASGAISYTWSFAATLSSSTGANVTATPSVTTIYTVTGVGSNGCINKFRDTVNVNTIPAVPTVITPIRYCQNSADSALSATGTALLWYNTSSGGTGSSTTPIPSTAAVDTVTYYVTQTIDGCESPRASIGVTILPLPSVAISPATAAICIGSDTTITVSGGVTYNWLPTAGLSASTGSVTHASPTLTTIYTVTGTGVNGCVNAASRTVIVNALPNITITPAHPIICNSTSSTLTANGAITYRWSGASTLSSSTGTTVTATPTITTIYTVMGTDANGCVNRHSDTVTVNAIPSPPTVTHSVSYCQNTIAASLSATGAGLLWYTTRTGGSGSSTAPTPSTAVVDTTIYYVSQTVTSCESPRDSITIIIKPLPIISISPATAVICRGFDTTLTASGAASYSWTPTAGLSVSTGSVSHAQPASTTIYTVSGTGANGCTNTNSRTVVVNPLPDVSVTPAHSTICNHTSSTLNANGAINYTWIVAASLSSSTGTIVVATPTVTTIYTVTGTDVNGCINRFFDTVSVNSIPAAPTVISSISYCQNVTATSLSATGADLLWYTTRTGGVASSTAPTPSTSSIGTTIYYVSQTVLGCESPRDSIAVTILPLPTVVISPATAMICIGLDTALSASGGVGYSWAPATGLSASTGSIIRAHPSSTTIYTVTATDTNSCSNTAARTVVVNPLPSISVTPLSPTICNHTNSTLTADGAITYTWTPAATLSSGTGVSVIANPSLTSTYTVTGTDVNGCVNSSSVTVNVNPIPAAPGVSSPVFHCLNITAPGLTSTGGDLLWYTSPTGGTGTSTAPVPSTAIVDTLTFYVSQTVSGCESPKDSISVIILPLPAISVLPAFPAICFGLDTMLTATGGTSYTWSPSTGLSATTGSAVDASPTSTTSYTVTGTGSNGCVNTASVNVVVNPLPANITGSSFACIGEAAILNDSTAGGIWISSDTSIAIISSSGSVSGISIGLATITYKLPTGCITTRTVPINSFPSGITGSANVCPGTSTLLADSTTGGSWSSSNTSIATINSTGLVSGILAGLDTMIYTLPSGCSRSLAFTVNPLPANITGPSSVCLNISALLTDASIGGAWNSSDTTIAKISSTGLVFGASTGIAIISYTLPTGCFVTYTMTVNPLPAGITGPAAVCPLQTITLSDSIAGGTWSSLYTTIASISTTGIVSGIAAGIDTIFYTFGTGCFKKTSITVNPLPATITGLTSLCVNQSTVLSDSSAGGMWSSSNVLLATVSSIGAVYGISSGIDTVIYTLPTSCFVTVPVTINPLPADISGSSSVCTGLATSLSDSTIGGTWSSVDPSIATISATGLVRGEISGTDTIVYSMPTGCFKKLPFTVNPLPALITGADSLCSGSISLLTDSSVGGTWTSSNISISTISPAGFMSGLLPGTDTITYTLPTGCVRTLSVKVNPLPLFITGIDSVCAGLTSLLSDATPFGTWASTNTSIATVNSSGLVTGLSAGSDTIRYILPTGCLSSLPFKVNPLPDPLFGDSTACVGSTILLTDSVGTLMYSVYAVTPGILTITLSTTSACNSHVSVTVYPNPLPILGATGLCLGTTSLLTDSVAGGRWTSSDTSIASIDASGLVFARAIGTATITYTLSTGCFATVPVHVNHLFTIAGIAATNPTTCLGTNGNVRLVGLGNGITYTVNYLKNGIPHSTFKTSDSAGVLLIDSLSAGIYTNINVALSGCTSNNMDTILVDPRNPSTPVLTSNSPVCARDTLYLNSTDSTFGVSYLWTGASGFTSTLQNCSISSLSYSDSGYYKLRVEKNNCFSADSIFIHTLSIPVVSTITAPSLICLGAVTTLTDSVAGGFWMAQNNNATIDSVTGFTTGRTYGLDTILYIKGNVCGSDTAQTILFVDRIPIVDSISGFNYVCVGSTINLLDTTTGGTWVATNANVTISSSGLVTGISPGIDTILYIVGNTCGSDTVKKTITIIPLPDAGHISGPSSVCVGTAINLTDTISGGTWSIGSTGVATINNAGVVFGLTAGHAVVHYTYTNLCGTADVTDTIIVNPQPYAGVITGINSLCIGGVGYLSASVSGGSWNSSLSGIATAATYGTSTDSAIITGIAAGNTIIRYIVTNVCGSDTSIHSVTVNPFAVLNSTLTPPAICSGTLFNYIPSSTSAGATLKWSRGLVAAITNPSDSGTGNINETLNSTSALPVTVSYDITITALGCSNIQQISVIVKPIPKLTSADSLTTCSNASISYLAASSTPGTTFTWTRPSVAGITPASGTGTNYISETLVNSTSVPIQVVYIFSLDAAGCPSTQNLYVTVEQNVPPNPIITTMSPSYLCLNTMYQNFGANIKPPAGTTYYWTTHGAEVWATGNDRQYCLVNFREQGLAWVVLNSTYSGNICASKDSFAVLVDSYISESPVVIYFHQAFVCELNIDDTYQWGYDDRGTLDSSLIYGETNQAYINDNPDFTHKYYWVITKHFDCIQKTYFMVPMEVQDQNIGGITSCNIFPNPNNGEFSVDVESDFTEKGTILVTNMIGEKLSEWPFTTNHKIDLHLTLPHGIYFVKVNTPHGTQVHKILIE